MDNKKVNLDNKDKKPIRYNEKNLIKKFLCSKEGVQFLNNGIKKTHGKDFDLETEIYNLIDFFVAWSLQFPVRKFSTMSKYEFIKYLEDFCDKIGFTKCLILFMSKRWRVRKEGGGVWVEGLMCRRRGDGGV